MKVQEQLKNEWPALKTETILGSRFYVTPEGKKYPSITTVLGQQAGKKKGLQEWRDRVGHLEANRIGRAAAGRGTAFHHICEDYINEQPLEHHKDKNFLAWCMFTQMKPHLDNNIDSVLLQEQGMYSDKYGVAGRCDLIGTFNGQLAVVDFKTTTKPKKEEWIDDYFIQCAAYASMFEEHQKVAVDKIVIMMVAEDGQVNIYEKNTLDYLGKLDTLMNEWYGNFEEKLGLMKA